MLYQYCFNISLFRCLHSRPVNNWIFRYFIKHPRWIHCIEIGLIPQSSIIQLVDKVISWKIIPIGHIKFSTLYINILIKIYLEQCFPFACNSTREKCQRRRKRNTWSSAANCAGRESGHLESRGDREESQHTQRALPGVSLQGFLNDTPKYKIADCDKK